MKTKLSPRWLEVQEQPKTSKPDFKDAVPELRRELVDLQQRLRNSDLAVMVAFAGVDGAGKHEMVNTLNAWMDPRGIYTHAYIREAEKDAGRPRYWKYWRDLPGAGQIGLYLSAWYSQPLMRRVHRSMSQEDFERELEQIDAFERTLEDNGVLLLKVWMHLDRKSQRKRLEKLSAKPETEWQVKPGAWDNWGRYHRFMDVSDTIVEHSEHKNRPWLLVNGKHKYSRQLTVAEALRDRLREQLDNPSKSKGLSTTAWEKKRSSRRGHLAAMDLSRSLEKKAYKQRMKKARRRLYQLQHFAEVAGLSTVLVFEGQDAAGKGGAIRRLVQGLDAQQYQVIPIAAPDKLELAHHYLWRFWRQLPRRGRVTIFDRSWYGRVLVERVEGFAEPAEWQRAYAEIADFESQLVREQTVVCKFWIQIDKETQLARFKERENTAYKEWKITEEDWRNREKWDAYNQSVDDMISLTHTNQAPWVLVEGNDKSWARVKVIETVCDQLEKALKKNGSLP